MDHARSALPRLVVALALVLAVAGIALWLTAPKPESGAHGAGDDGIETATTSVGVWVAAVHATRDEIVSTGIVRAGRRVTVRAEVEGRVVAREVGNHQSVRAGTELLRLDDTLRRTALARAEAAVIRTRAAHHLSRIELDRKRSLAERGTVSRAALDAAQSRERQAYGTLAEAQAVRDEARELLARTRIQVPFDGVLEQFDLEVGDRVAPNTVIGEVLDLTKVKVELGLTEQEIVAVHEGVAAVLHVEVYPDRAFPGTIHRVGHATDPHTRTFPVEVLIENPGGLLRSGMVANVRFAVGDEHPAMRIPRQATVKELGLTYLYVLDTTSKPVRVRRRRVTLRDVPFRPGEIEVVKGLSSGERVATGDLRALRDGAAVSIEKSS